MNIYNWWCCCSFLLLVLDEHKAFAILEQLNAREKYIPGYWAAEAIALATDAHVFNELLRQQDPEVADFLGVCVRVSVLLLLLLLLFTCLLVLVLFVRFLYHLFVICLIWFPIITLAAKYVFPNTFCQKWFAGLCVHVLPFEDLCDFLEMFFEHGELTQRFVF